jgi:hypothetical protein
MPFKIAPQKMPCIDAMQKYAKMPATMTANAIMQKCIAKKALKNDAEMHCATALQKYYVKCTTIA